MRVLGVLPAEAAKNWPALSCRFAGSDDAVQISLFELDLVSLF